METQTQQKTAVTPEQAYYRLRTYNGQNGFVNSVKGYYEGNGFITEKQLQAVIRFFGSEKIGVPQQLPMPDLNVPVTIPEKKYNENPNNNFSNFTLKNPVMIKLKGLQFVKSLCEKMQIGNVKSYAWVVKEVTGQTARAIRVKAEIPDNTHTLNFCRNCGRRLTDDFSIATGMGKICANYYGIPYIKDISQALEFKDRVDELIKTIGVQEFWLPKSRIELENLTELMNEIKNS